MIHPALPRLLCVIACSIALTGCSSKARKLAKARKAAEMSQDGAQARGKRAGKSGNAVFANEVAGANGAPSTPARLRVVKLEVHHLVIPLGAISRSDEFWKHVEEQRVDVGTYDLLRKNGWRIGIAPTSEWAYFRDIIDGFPASAKKYDLSAGPIGAKGLLELEMKEKIPYQNIFYFNDENLLHGRTFERCDNLLNITLQQAPRKPGDARVTVCPTVRALHRRYEVTSKGGEDREIRYVHPERLYDLNCQIDLPPGNFLVIAPSPEVKWKASLGAAFLVKDEPSEQREQVLIMVPRTAELEEVPVAPPAKR